MPKDTQVNELERCRPWIEAALEYSGGTHEFEDVAKGIIEGRMQLWPSPRGCIVTEIVVYPNADISLAIPIPCCKVVSANLGIVVSVFDLPPLPPLILYLLLK